MLPFCNVTFFLLLGLIGIAVSEVKTRPKITGVNRFSTAWSSMWSGPKLTRTDKKNFKLLFLLGIVGLETSSEIFVRLPQRVVYGSTPIYASDRKPSEESMLIIFPGAGGPDEITDALKQKIETEDRREGLKRHVEVYDWLKWRGSFLRAAFDSQAVGKTVCTELAKSEERDGKIRDLHAIGVSVGAFAADSCTRAYKEESSDPGNVRLTLLDPFTSKGVFGYAWGVSHFGVAADVAEVYLNRDDPVPTTNEPIDHAFNIDVTKSRLRNSFRPTTGDSMHSWPLAYLAETWKTEVDQKTHLPKVPELGQRGEMTEVF